MTKKDWKEFQVCNPDFGTKLVSELTEEQAKNELCVAIDILERVLECNKKAIEVAYNVIIKH